MPEKFKKFKIVNIHRNFRRNKNTSVLENYFYAELRDEDNKLWISDGLDCIMSKIVERGLILVDDKL